MDKLEIIKQRIKLPIKNVEISGDENIKTYSRHGALLPNCILSIVCGKSNCGKTNVMLSLLESPNALWKYVYLKQMLSSIKGINCYMFSSNENVVPIEDVKPNSIFIFDDVICDKQNNIRAYFCMGRHKAVDCFYLSQSYAHIPKHLIRENCNFLILFQQDNTSFKHVFNDFGISIDMSFETFKNICEQCWSKKYGFLVIDNERGVNDGKYRLKFDSFISIPKNTNT